MALKVFSSLEALRSSEPSKRFRPAVAIGNLDGVHLGHQKLIKSARESAEKIGGVLAVLTFSPHPQEVLSSHSVGRRISTDVEKFALLSELGVELILALKFDSELARLPPEKFFEHYLKDGLCAASVHVGFDFHFGRARSGNVELLQTYGKQAAIEIDVLPAVVSDGVKLSSSLVRDLIRAGEVSRASAYLGRPYRITGKVVRGAGRGNQLGTPTANIEFPPSKCAPKLGVYAVRARHGTRTFAAVANFGLRPTFEKSAAEPLLEVHLLDCSEDLYAESITVEFLQLVREERRFENIESLRAQIQADISFVRSLKTIPG